jgi:alkylated DNA repair protein (DNA oxidative demethylase)
MVTPGGYTMSVAMTNCGHLGWTTDQHGYLYSPFDPLTGVHWPPLPDALLTCVNRRRRRQAMLIFNPMPA